MCTIIHVDKYCKQYRSILFLAIQFFSYIWLLRLLHGNSYAVRGCFSLQICRMIVDCSHCQHSSRCPIELALDLDQSVPENTPALQVMTKCNISPFSKTYACAWYIGGFYFHTWFEISAIPIALCNLCTTPIHAVNVKPILKGFSLLGTDLYHPFSIEFHDSYANSS